MRFAAIAADGYVIGRYREFSKALAALDSYRGLRRSWKVLMAFAVVAAAGAIVLAVTGFELLY
jgi:hypothetical protein